VVEVKGKPRLYFEVSDRAPLHVSVNGPARLRIVSRAEIGVAETAASYSVKVALGGTTIGEASTASAPAPATRRKDGNGVLCKSRTLVVRVPAGPQRLTITTSGAPRVFLRLLLASTRPAPETRMVSLTPVEAPRSVTVVEGERMIPYYTARPGAPVRFRVVGPTTVEFSSRLDFDSTMRGRQRYRLGFRVEGRVQRERSFSTTKATGAVYREVKDRVPSKRDRVVLSLGDGSHDVSVEMIAPKRGTAQIHARIPQPAVGNAE
jgi:hypothetical protein